MEPISLAAVAITAIAAIAGSDTVRKILGSILGRPKSRSVIVTYGDETLVINDVSADEQKRLIDEFVSKHTQGSSKEDRDPQSADETPGPATKGDGA